MNNPEQLIVAHLDDALSDAARVELNAWLKADPSNLRRFTEDVIFEQQIRTAARASAEQHAAADFDSSIADVKARTGWNQWRPLAVAAAGIAIGLFCATVAWAVALPHAVATAERLFALVDGGFEDGPVEAGFPKQAGVWSGDASEIVVAAGAKAREGRGMLRFVKAEGDSNNPEGRALACDLFQLVDLRPLRASLGADGDSLLELSASFLDGRPANTKPSVTFFCQIYLFKGDAGSLYQTWPNNISEAIASGSARVTTLGGNGAAWRQLTAKSLVSAEADFAVVQISARPNLRVPMPVRLFVDDVKLTLKTQPALPVRVVQR